MTARAFRGVCAGAAIIAVSLASPAVASKAKKYSGSVKPSGVTSYDIKKVEGTGARVATHITYGNVPVACKGGSPGGTTGTTSGDIPGKFELDKDGNFSAVHTEGEGPPYELKARTRSKATGKQNQRMKGEMSIEGTQVPLDSGGTGFCISGTLKWTADVQ